MKGELETEQNCNILNSRSYAHNSVSFLFFWAAQLGVQPLWDMVLIPASSLQLFNRRSWGPLCWVLVSFYSILSPTDSNFLCTELYYCFMPTKFNLSTVKVIPLKPSTGCTCYLHRCISYFDSSATQLLCRVVFISWCLRRLIRGISTGSSIFYDSEEKKTPNKKAKKKCGKKNSRVCIRRRIEECVDEEVLCVLFLTILSCSWSHFNRSSKSPFPEVDVDCLFAERQNVLSRLFRLSCQTSYASKLNPIGLSLRPSKRNALKFPSLEMAQNVNVAKVLWNYESDSYVDHWEQFQRMILTTEDLKKWIIQKKKECWKERFGLVSLTNQPS